VKRSTRLKKYREVAHFQENVSVSGRLTRFNWKNNKTIFSPVNSSKLGICIAFHEYFWIFRIAKSSSMTGSAGTSTMPHNKGRVLALNEVSFT